MLGIRSVVTAVSVATAVIAAGTTPAFGQRYGFAYGYDDPYVFHYDDPYYAHDYYFARDHDFRDYEPDYRLFDQDVGEHSHRARFASWFVPETYEPTDRPTGSLPRPTAITGLTGLRTGNSMRMF
ncbi:MAG: hypothetical protein O3C40_37940 [Planctomycetota bacterium]|nr:hypothetical protein [Planctomycetota bacterium]